MAAQQLKVRIYQLMDDKVFRSNRTDGFGWDLSWADYQRDWMNATPSRHAYRCLPLTIVNQTGWWIKNPVGFTATWNGSFVPGSIQFQFDSPDPAWAQSINSQFGEGIITWNTPFLFRTEPVGSRLLILGPTNYFRKNAQPLTALIESDWMIMSFTMNYKVLTPNEPLRFEAGEPLFQAIPLANNICTDLEEAEVRYQRLHEAPEIHRAYHEWSTSRTQFHEQKARHEVKGDQWQKDYFQGRDATGRPVAMQHKTKLKPPQILFGPGEATETTASIEIHHPDQDPPMAESASSRPRPRPRRQPDHWHKDPSRADQDAGAVGLVDPVDRSNPANSGAPQLASCPVTHVQASAAGPSESNGHSPSASNGRVAPAARPAETITTADHSPTREQPAMSNGATSQLEPAAANQARNDAHQRPRADDEWRRWIAENLLLDAGTASIIESMVAAGFDRNEAAHEVDLALCSPYFKGTELLRNRLKKRDWLLATYRKLNRFNPELQSVPRRHKLSRGQFVAEYLSASRPVIITGMMDDWPALRKWNLDFFADNFGDREVEVQFGRNSGENYEIEKHKFVKKFAMRDYVEMVRNAGKTNDFYLTAVNNSSNQTVLPELWDDIVQVPEYLDARNPHNGFLWFGPTGTITPFHHDLTNNFMAQVVGRKKVKIVPSWDMPVMRNTYHVFSEVDGRIVPQQVAPPLHEPQILECVLNPGEILFLPIGSLHFVEGLEISVTISFTNLVYDNDFVSNYSTFQRV